jgi:ankyrin repeat protein
MCVKRSSRAQFVDCSVFVQHGQTPIHIAAENGHVEPIRILIEAKADMNAANEVPLKHATRIIMYECSRMYVFRWA